MIIYTHMEAVKVTRDVISKDLCKKITEKYKDFLKANPKEVATLEDPIKEFVVSDRSIDWIEIEDELVPQIKQVVKEYLDQFGCMPGLATIDNYRYGSSMIMHQPEGYNIVYHYDSELEVHLGEPEIRNFGCLLYLNKDYEAGELVFPLQDIIVTPDVGTVCIFPTSLMYPHLTTPPMGSARYVMRFNFFFKQEYILNCTREYL